MINSRKILLVVHLHQCITPGSVSGLKVIFAKEKPLLPSNDEIKNFHSQVYLKFITSMILFYFFYMICFSKFFFVGVFVSEVKRNSCKKFFSFLVSFSHLISYHDQSFICFRKIINCFQIGLLISFQPCFSVSPLFFIVKFVRKFSFAFYFSDSVFSINFSLLFISFLHWKVHRQNL